MISGNIGIDFSQSLFFQMVCALNSRIKGRSVMKRFFALALVFVMVIMSSASLAAESSGKEKTFRMSFAQVWDEKHGYTQAAKAMIEYLAGTIKLDVYPSGQLGDERSVFESIQLGTIDCAFFSAPVLSGFSNLLEGFDAPYLWVADDGSMDTGLHDEVVSSSFAREYLDAVRKDVGVVGVGFLYNPGRDFCFRKPFKSLDDAPGFKIRSMEAAMHIAMYKAMGFVPAPMPYSEIYQAMNTGVIDGFEDTAISIVNVGTYEVGKQIVKSAHATSFPIFIMSEKAWATLTPDEQQMMVKATNIGRQAAYKQFAVVQPEAYKLLEKAGLEISQLDITRARALCMPVIEEICAKDEKFKAVYDYVQEVKAKRK
jgi:TRAP-type C4-dicarboxylate transport system substrate-binding protein